MGMMGGTGMSSEKDIGEKTLFDAADVFADILNVLLFGGEEAVLPQDLVSTTRKSQIKIDGRLHEQERDVSKFWTKKGMYFALIGFENQTDADPLMPLRVVSYDGAEYKAQVIQKKAGNQPDEGEFHLYPVITLVLYFGKSRWKQPKTLKEVFDGLPPELEPYVSDYSINVFEISYLEPETVAKFKSDFRIVADYFVQIRKNKAYIPSDTEIRHVDEVLKLMSVLTGDARFEQEINDIREKGGVSMCAVLDQFLERGMQQGIKQGIKQGKDEAIMKAICAVADVLSPAEISKRFDVPKEVVIKILQDANLMPI